MKHKLSLPTRTHDWRSYHNLFLNQVRLNKGLPLSLRFPTLRHNKQWKRHERVLIWKVLTFEELKAGDGRYSQCSSLVAINSFFLKDFANNKMSEQHYAKYLIYLSMLLQEQPLPQEALDHALKGEWKCWREFHISGDLLLIYRIEEQKLELARMGTHSELFG